MLLFLKWLFGMIEKTQLHSEVHSNRVLLRGPDMLPLPGKPASDFQLFILNEAKRHGVFVKASVDETGLWITIEPCSASATPALASESVAGVTSNYGSGDGAIANAVRLNGGDDEMYPSDSPMQ